MRTPIHKTCGVPCAHLWIVITESKRWQLPYVNLRGVNFFFILT